MQTAESWGLFGSLAAVVTASLTLHNRRNARQTARREDEARLCVSRLQALGAAIHAYRQDHENAMPRKFICLPHSVLTQGGWSADWNEASLADYITDESIYSCPCGGVYCDRVPLLLRDGPRQLMRPTLTSVVLYCSHHAHWGGPKEDHQGEFIVLRMNGTVERIPASEIDIWQYSMGQWYPPEELAIAGGNIWHVFPGEPWPPPLEPAPFRPWWPGDKRESKED